MNDFLSRVIEVKQREVANLVRSSTAPARASRRSFFEALLEPGLSVIAEVKRRSPSRGEIAVDLDVRALTQSYAKGGASAVSCLTDATFFGARPGDMEDALEVGLPVLRKDFIIHEAQVEETRNMGASALLLIVSTLDPGRLQALADQATALGLDVLFEAHDEKTIATALRAGARIVGINNRDLTTLEVDETRALRLRREIPGGVLSVAESGVRSAHQAKALKEAGFDAILVGEYLSSHKNPAAAVRDLRRC